MADEGKPIYTIRPWHNDGQYYLIKWPEFGMAHKEPLDIYYMTKNYCGCPSPRRPCKHVAIKEALLSYAANHNLPLYMVAYNSSSNEIFTLADFADAKDLPTF